MERASPLDPDTLLRHEEFVLRLARTLVRDDSDAREVVQRTLVSAIEHPPQHSGIRAWLARVTQNHAHDLHRGTKRRTARERYVARPEAVVPESSAVERLELESDVVRAVLALDDPYRSVIVATYYEELAPAEIAKQRGVPAGTVRSQLTRAHELLRAKLDSRHGERANWMHGLTGLLALSDAPSAAPSIGMPLAIGMGVAACVVGALVVRAMLTPTSTFETSAVEPPGSPMKRVETALGASKPAPTRSVIETTAIVSTVALGSFAPADEPVKLLEQSRQIKKLVLDRRLAVTAEERARAGIPVDTATSGVVRLLDRTPFGERYSLPWMRGGGSYYSFTERVHDYDRRPQISLDEGTLYSSFYGGGAAIVIDLGERRLADVPASRIPPHGLDRVGQLRWEIAHMEMETSMSGFRAAYALRVNEARERGEIDDARASDMMKRSDEFAPALDGHAYLIRSVSENEHDIIVALEVIASAPDQCTIAYRILESRPISNPDSLRVPVLRADELAAPPPELRRMSEAELVLALGSVRTRADEILFLEFTPEIEQRFGTLRTRADSGLTRIVPYLSEWSELAAKHLGGAQYSFSARSHDADTGDISFQGRGPDAALGDGLSGGDTGVFLDLGTIAFEGVGIGAILASGETGALLADHAFPVRPELPTTEPARRNAMQAFGASAHAARREFQVRANALRIFDRAPAIVGHTYALRSVRIGSHDILAAVHIAAIDEQGVVIAWKVLKSWPVAQRD